MPRGVAVRIRLLPFETAGSELAGLAQIASLRPVNDHTLAVHHHMSFGSDDETFTSHDVLVVRPTLADRRLAVHANRATFVGHD